MAPDSNILAWKNSTGRVAWQATVQSAAEWATAEHRHTQAYTGEERHGRHPRDEATEKLYPPPLGDFFKVLTHELLTILLTNQFIPLTSVEVADDTKETLLNAEECVHSPSTHSTRFPRLRRPERGRKGGFCQPWAGSVRMAINPAFPLQQTAAPEPSLSLHSGSPQMHTDIKAWELWAAKCNT